MPELADRAKHEERLAAALLILFRDAERAVGRGERVNWGELAERISREFEDQLAAIYVLAFMAFAPDTLQFSRDLANSQARNWASTHGRALSRAWAETARQQIGTGLPAERVFAPGRTRVVVATEVTRAVTTAETDVRRAVVLAGDTPQTPQDRRPANRPPFDIGDNLVPVWHTEKDERVCPICSPLDRQRFEAWAERFPNGPPAHPNCRCHLEYVEL